MNRRLLRFLTLCLALWLPAHTVLAGVLHETLHAHEAHAGAVHDHAGDGSAQADSDNDDCSSAHALCHLALSPGLVGSLTHAGADGVQCLHPAPTPVFGDRSPDRITRPPLARA